MGKISIRSDGLLFAGASSLALAICAASTSAFAQDADDSAAKEADPPSDAAIIVTGVRGALQTAAVRKRNADTVMDSITATDIGAFPDKSVAEALQRVPGITVNRFALNTDTAHFTAEPSGVIVRGLPQVRNEFNGRDTFSANSSRGLSWGDVPAELLGGVDVYKSPIQKLLSNTSML
ncbi:TonB-dependent receptor plug domain-containing protein [Sphingobium olei]